MSAALPPPKAKKPKKRVRREKGSRTASRVGDAAATGGEHLENSLGRNQATRPSRSDRQAIFRREPHEAGAEGTTAAGGEHVENTFGHNHATRLSRSDRLAIIQRKQHNTGDNTLNLNPLCNDSYRNSEQGVDIEMVHFTSRDTGQLGRV